MSDDYVSMGEYEEGLQDPPEPSAHQHALATGIAFVQSALPFVEDATAQSKLYDALAWLEKALNTEETPA